MGFIDLTELRNDPEHAYYGVDTEILRQGTQIGASVIREVIDDLVEPEITPGRCSTEAGRIAVERQANLADSDH